MDKAKYREAIDKMLDRIDAKGLERIYYFLLGWTGIIIELDNKRRKCHE